MICTHVDSYMNRLIMEELMISWVITLTDNTTIYGDYDRPDLENPWLRLKKHCETNNVYPAIVELYMFGAPRHVFFENPKGLDGLKMMRGIAKDQAMDGSHSQSFQTLTAILLKDDCTKFDISKYTWPHNDFEQAVATREVTVDNIQDTIFKHDSRKNEHPEVQKHLHRISV